MYIGHRELGHTILLFVREEHKEKDNPIGLSSFSVLSDMSSTRVRSHEYPLETRLPYAIGILQNMRDPRGRSLIEIREWHMERLPTIPLSILMPERHTAFRVSLPETLP